MKKILTFQLIYFFIIIYSYAQDWNPINSYEKFNYRLTGANIVSAQIKADSVAKLINGDSVYYLNRIARYCDTCQQTSYIRSNLPQFLQRQVTLKGNGVFNFKDTLNLALYTLAPLGYSWLYDSTTAINAKVVATTIESVVGTTDSVKVIQLSSGDTIKLSKSYGIIKYPYKYGITDSCYTLTGIAGRNVGEQLSGFKGAFNWSVGDMFEIQWMEDDEGLGQAPGPVSVTYKFTINNKYVNGDTMKYVIYLQQYFSGYWPFYNINYRNPIDTLIFIDSANHIANNYPGQLCNLPINWNNSYPNQFQNYFTNNGGYFSNNGEGGYPYPYPGITTISADKLGEISEDAFSSHLFDNAQFHSGLGLTSYTIADLEYSESWTLVAYRKGNDTVGTFTPDSDFPTAIAPAQSAKAALVYPNPAKDNITIAFTQPQQGAITISNVQGQTVKEEKLGGVSTTIDVSALAPGIYILSVGTTEGTEYFKVIKQ